MESVSAGARADQIFGASLQTGIYILVLYCRVRADGFRSGSCLPVMSLGPVHRFRKVQQEAEYLYISSCMKSSSIE